MVTPGSGGGSRKGPQGTSPRPYLSRPHRREGPSREASLAGSVSRLRRPNHCPRRQGRRLRVVQELPSRGDRADPHARLGAQSDARMAPAIREAPLVNRLVSDACPQTRRRGTRAVPSSRLAGAVDRHRHLRVLVCSSRRRVPRRLTDSVCRGHRLRRPVPTKRVPGQFSQRNRTADRDTAVIDGWHELAVANPTFLLVILGC
jgi:hypothetical protein